MCLCSFQLSKNCMFWSSLCNWCSYPTNTYFFKPNKCQAMIGKTNKTSRVGERWLYLQSHFATNCTFKYKSFYACIRASRLVLIECGRAALLRRKWVSTCTANMPETNAKIFLSEWYFTTKAAEILLLLWDLLKYNLLSCTDVQKNLFTQ